MTIHPHDCGSAAEADDADAMDRARELFFRYEGSGFFMSRDGADAQYRRYAVPPELEQQWRTALTAQKVAELRRAATWPAQYFALYYLRHHGDTRYLPEAMRAEPVGEYWQRCAYLEQLLDYAGQCARSHPLDEIRPAVETVLRRAELLDEDSAPQQQRGRKARLIEQARQALSIVTGGGSVHEREGELTWRPSF